MEQRWELASDVDLTAVETLRSTFDIHPIVARVLVLRGIRTTEEAQAFFHPELASLHDPLLLSGMETAAGRLADAIRNKERIWVYGDYDVDGITSVSLLYLFFRKLGGDVGYYIPNRQYEGYGISIAGLQNAIENGAKLVVTVDCGITSVEEVAWANERGLEMIISDHHQPGETIPKAIAVVNPKAPGNTYPFTELAGVGVAYKLAQGVCQELGLEMNYLDELIDLVAMGTAADIVPLVDENRIFVRHGLQKINTNPLVGIRALIEIANLRFGKIAVGQIIYGLAPRLNAVGRLGSAERAVELMITQNSQHALHLAGELEQENRNRKAIDTRTLDEALRDVELEFDPGNDKVIVLAREKWHSGVIGIVASRLIERFYRPTVMITVEEGVGKGSARSIPGFDLYDAMRECGDLLLQFGGHTYAAGLTVDADKISDFRDRFNEVATARLSDEDLVPKLSIDAELNLNDVTDDLYSQIRRFAPFGPHNPQPIFVSYNVALSGYPRIVGNNHLKFQLKRSGPPIDCIGFNLGDRIQRLNPSRAVNHVVYTIDENEWNGKVSLQLRIRDVKSGDM